MYKKFTSLFCLLLLSLTTGCYSAKDGASAGLFITSTVDTVQAFNGVKPKREGKACRFNIGYLYAAGDSSVGAAKNDGGITDIASIDRSYFNFTPLFTRSCVIVKGQ